MNLKKFPTLFLIWILLYCLDTSKVFSVTESTGRLPGFSVSSYFNEQVITFNFNPEMRIHINAPEADSFDINKPVGIALFALPNGNTIEHTVGKILQPGDDWHFDIQHIGAQTRFLRRKIIEYNLVTVYLETKQLSWPLWKSKYNNYAGIVKTTIEYLKSFFKDYQPFIILTGHSGGGRFIFSFLDAFSEIPDYVDRICFLDSNYGYENVYGDQMINWLNASPDHSLCVLAYNDSVALYQGQAIVSATGGTWYRSRLMQRYFANFYPFETEEDDEFIRHSAIGGRIKILLKKNPEKLIFHTVQVERNGFIHSMLTGTPLENEEYQYYGERAYSNLVQAEELTKSNFQIPPRSPDARTGSQFMHDVNNMSFVDREEAILEELLTGNLPYFLRELKEFETTFTDANGNSHQVTYRVMPDYMAIGSDSDFCRIPMGPLTAQKAADFFGGCMPTRKLVDQIYLNSEIKLEPVTYAPVGNENEQVSKFIEHNAAIESQRLAVGGELGQLTGGTKKDVVLSNKIADPSRPGHVVIYGWHQLNGEPIQPLTNIHINTYVDYSHGIRFLDAEIAVDGTVKTIQDVLRDDVLYRLLSDENGAMSQPTYILDEEIPDKPSSFGILNEQGGGLKILITPDAKVDFYNLYLSGDGLNFDLPVQFTGNEFILTNQPCDSIIYFKLKAENTAGVSMESEVLAGIARADTVLPILIVNGFDRTSTGNTFNFIRQHASAITHNNMSFESATNDAVINGLIELNNYLVVDYILGDESTVDESFSNSEQTIVSNFLKGGGRLFVSGAEIAWDLDYKGSSSDKTFCYDYLKAKYSADAPGGISGTYYTAEGVSGSLFEAFDSISFDNGTHGTINVKYADALIVTNGSSALVRYKNVTVHDIGGVIFEGMFKNGTQSGKLIYLGFPFETIYPETNRNILMGETLAFLCSNITTVNSFPNLAPKRFYLTQNYPNPFNPVTTIQFFLPEQSDVTISIFNILGERIRQYYFKAQHPGVHLLSWDGKNSGGIFQSSGTYICRMTTGSFQQSIKLVLAK